MICHCGHPRGLHVGVSECRVNGCRCPQFRDSAKPEPAVEETEGRRVCFNIPAGFSFHVSFVPIFEVPDEEAVEEPASG